MKLHMMTHGDPHEYEDSQGGNMHDDQLGDMPSPYCNAEFHGQVGYPSKYYNDCHITDNSPAESQTSAMASIRSEGEASSFTQCYTASAANEDMLLRAAEEQLRPLIKEELRYTIQSKRAARGLPSHVEIEYKIPQSEPDTPATMIKRQRRRERNKIAAAKCRFKKKVLSDQLVEESEKLENQNQKLKTEVQRLQEERQKLIFILNLHRPTCIVRSPPPPSPSLDLRNQSRPSCSPNFARHPCSQEERDSDSFQRLSPGSRASSHDDDTLSGITPVFTYPAYSSTDERTNTATHRSVIVESRSLSK